MKVILLLLFPLFSYANTDSIKFKKIAQCLYRLETGNGKSVLCKTHNNLFGFKPNANTLHIGKTKDGYCIYANKHASVRDYIRREKALIKRGINTEKKYLAHLFKYYARGSPTFKRNFLSIYHTMK